MLPLLMLILVFLTINKCVVLGLETANLVQSTDTRLLAAKPIDRLL